MFVGGMASALPSPPAVPGHGGMGSLDVKGLSVLLQSFCEEQRAEPAGWVTQPRPWKWCLSQTVSLTAYAPFHSDNMAAISPTGHKIILVLSWFGFPGREISYLVYFSPFLPMPSPSFSLTPWFPGSLSPYTPTWN